MIVNLSQHRALSKVHVDADVPPPRVTNNPADENKDIAVDDKSGDGDDLQEMFETAFTQINRFSQDLANTIPPIDFSPLAGNQFALFKDNVALQARINLSKTLRFKVFVVISTLLALAEPVLVGFQPVGNAYTLQLLVLAASSIAFFIDIILTVIHYQVTDSNSHLTSFQIFKAMIGGEVILDAMCITFGWCTIFRKPGLAALRCLRVFRLLWYFELFPDIKDANFDPSTAIFSLRKASQLCLIYMTRIAEEIFTQQSKGGIVVIGMYFYISYLIAVVFWVELTTFISEGHSTECSDLTSCFITMIRLSFYDGNGFDFVQTLAAHGFSGYTVLCFVYMILSSIILLNGLIGIFGNAFSGAEENNKIQPDSAPPPAVYQVPSRSIPPSKQPSLVKMSSPSTMDDKIISPRQPIISPRQPVSRSSSFLKKHPFPHLPLPINEDDDNQSQVKIITPATTSDDQTKELISLIRSLKDEISLLNNKVSDLQTKVTFLADNSVTANSNSNLNSNAVSAPALPPPSGNNQG
jgi:hypothetical protein